MKSQVFQLRRRPAQLPGWWTTCSMSGPSTRAGCNPRRRVRLLQRRLHRARGRGRGGSQTFRKSPIARRTHHDRCQVPKHTGVDAHLGADVPAGAWVSEPHIKAMVIAAAFGFPFGHAVSETCSLRGCAQRFPHDLGRRPKRVQIGRVVSSSTSKNHQAL
jgi:hypothetical protein